MARGIDCKLQLVKSSGQRSDYQPFPQNPTFRPPPPLSNDLQNVIADRHHAGENLGQLSQAFGISKARIEAVLKLKELEARYKRQVSFFPFSTCLSTQRIYDERYLT